MQETAELVYSKEVIKFDVTESTIAEIKEKYMALKIAGIEDRDGYEKVDKARKKVVKLRTSVTKHGKALREDATAYNRRVKAREDEIVGLLEPVETHLKNEQAKVDAEKERIKAEEAAKEQARIQGMLDELLKYGSSLPVMAVATMTDSEYVKVLADAKAAHEAKMAAEAEAKRQEEERLAKEEAERKAENERLEKIRKEQEAEQAKIKAEKERIDAWMKEQHDQIEAEKRKLIEQQAAIDRAEDDEARRIALMPDKETLLGFGQFLIEGITYPAVKSEKALEAVGHVRSEMSRLVVYLKKVAEEI